MGSKLIPPGLKPPAGTADNHEGHLSKCLAVAADHDENLIQVHVHLFIKYHGPGSLHAPLAEEWAWPGLPFLYAITLDTSRVCECLQKV